MAQTPYEMFWVTSSYYKKLSKGESLHEMYEMLATFEERHQQSCLGMCGEIFLEGEWQSFWQSNDRAGAERFGGSVFTYDEMMGFIAKGLCRKYVEDDEEEEPPEAQQS